jgi:hypothetical protein
MNRGNLRWLLIELARRRGETIAPLLAEIDKLEGLARLRNALTHTFEGVSQAMLARDFGGKPADAIVPHLARLYTLATGRAPGDSPFQKINLLLATLLREADRP